MALDFIIWPEFLLSLDIYNYKSCSAIHNISISFVIKQNNFQSNLFCRNPLVFLSNLNLFSFSREICSLDQHGVWGENKAIVKKEDLATEYCKGTYFMGKENPPHLWNMVNQLLCIPASVLLKNLGLGTTQWWSALLKCHMKKEMILRNVNSSLNE